MADRVSGGVTAALTGYLLVVQLFAAALMCGMTVPVEAGPQFVLCQPSQASADRAVSTEGDTHGFFHDCPCVICQGSDGDPTLALAPGADLGPAFASREPVAGSFKDDPDRLIDPSRLGLAPSPRGPPSVA